MDINIKEYKNGDILTASDLNDSFMAINNGNIQLNEIKKSSDTYVSSISNTISKINELLLEINNKISNNEYFVEIQFNGTTYQNNGNIQNDIINSFKYQWEESEIPKYLGKLNFIIDDQTQGRLYRFPTTNIYYGYSPFDSSNQYFYFSVPTMLLLYIGIKNEIIFNENKIYYCYIGDIDRTIINSQNFPNTDQIIGDNDSLSLNIVDQTNSEILSIMLEN